MCLVRSLLIKSSAVWLTTCLLYTSDAADDTPCVGIRAVPIGEAMFACVLLDHFLLNRGQCG